MTRQETITEIKNRSRHYGVAFGVYSNKERREFFRYNDGWLTEYDMTMYKKKYIYLTPTELSALQVDEELMLLTK